MQFKNACYKVAIELQVVQFLSEITLVIYLRHSFTVFGSI